jgi:hypothetical protein
MGKMALTSTNSTHKQHIPLRSFATTGILAVSLLVAAAAPQARASGTVLPYRLVNAHTAGVLPEGFFDIDFRIYASRGGYGTGLITGAHVGITKRLSIGLSYGGEGIVGYSDRVRWNDLPGVMLKYRLFEEKFVTPALVLGFDNQGYGGPAGAAEYGYDGYIYKSPGFFVSLSKSYIMLNTAQIGFHGTVNYSLEGMDDVSWPSAAGGIDIGINDELLFFAEYDFALNDITGAGNKKHYWHPHKGFLNLGIRWAFTENFHIEFDAIDILENKTRRVPRPTVADPQNHERVAIGWGRELKVAYISKF